MTPPRQPHLRVVENDAAPQPAADDDDDLSDLWIDPGVGDPLAEVADRSVKEKAPPLPYNGNRLFDPVYLTQLADRRWDSLNPPLARLYRYLRIKARRGARRVRLTNEMATEIGIDRSQKTKLLKRLEALKLVKVTRDGQKNPEVRVLSPRRPAP